MSTITTHVLDTARGCPAEGIAITLEQRTNEGAWQKLGSEITGRDGRSTGLLAPQAKLQRGEYRLTFDTAAYYKQRAIESFYPRVSVTFRVDDPAQHYHVPLLLSPYGYSTYRGS